MAVTLKPNAAIIVPKSIRRKAGFKPGERVEFRVSDRTIMIVPKLTPDEIQDEREIRDPKIRGAIRKSYQEFLAGKSRPIEELFIGRAARRCS
jgi:AbrB family looped-hinge helix DNA binding protein